MRQQPGFATENIPELPEFSAEYDGYARLSPACIEPIFGDPYRCPVSTPTISRQHSGTRLQNQHGPYIAFASLNRSMQIPNNISSPKHSKYRNAKTRPVAKPQKKNFDCYFVKKINNNGTHIDAQKHGSTWLSTLCAQPVDEIFGKYKRKSEVNSLSRQVNRSCNSTPGEKALMTAWSSNSSNRGLSSVMSKSTKSGYVTSRKNSKTSYTEPNLRVVGFDSDSDKFVNNIGFALVPVSSPNFDDADDVTMTSSRDSPVFQKVFKINYNQHPNTADVYRGANETFYEPYQRDKRFPEIRRRKSTLSPTRKRIQSEVKETPSSTSKHPIYQELEESPMHIVTIGQALGSSPEPTKTSLPLSRPCSYRLPKSLSMSLPELHGTG